MNIELLIDYLGLKMLNNDQIKRQEFGYGIIFIIENLLRVSMHNIMVEKVGINYFNENVFSPNIIKVHNDRKSTEKIYNLDMGYDYPGFWYLDYSILIKLLEQYWDTYYHAMFTKPTEIKQEIIQRLNNIKPARNSIAHHRYISNIDISDLQKTIDILYRYLNKDKFINFNSVAFNTFEENIKRISVLIENLKQEMITGQFIDKEKIIELNNTLSAYVIQRGNNKLLIQLDDLTIIFEQYNKLPRKPGRANEIDQFLEKNKIIQKLNDLLKILGE